MTAQRPEDLADIHEMLIKRDVAAFIAGAWESVAGDFDADTFVGYAGRDGSDAWDLKYPTLADYRDDWLGQSTVMTARQVPDLEKQLLAAQTLASVEIKGDQALVRKVFDGVLNGPSGTSVLDWQTHYFLRKLGARWRITGFAGYLPSLGGSARLTYPASSQHETAGPYSPVVEVAAGRLVVISGQGPLDDAGRVVGSTIEEQSLLTLENCRSQLAAAGASFDNVFKVNAYLADLGDWEGFNEAYRSVMPSPRPARATVGVRLLLGMKVEIEMWAAP